MNKYTLAASLTAVCLGAGIAFPMACHAPPPKVAADTFCAARKAYKDIAAAQGGSWDPKPGTARYELEKAEDEFCATLSP